jgi:uncharacterized protein (TIGR00255 family)
MTAYGRGEYRLDDTLFTAEISSVNHRYRNIFLRLPKNFQAIEEELKRLISSRIRRGRIEASIQMERTSTEQSYNLELNVPLVRSYLEIFSRLAKEFGVEQKVSVETLCQMQDVILVQPTEIDLEQFNPGFHAVLSAALDSYDEMRTKEGSALESDFKERLGLLERLTSEIDARAPVVVEAYRNRLQENIARLLQETPVDEARLAQEVAIFAERSDITEELVRIRSHLKQFHDYLATDDALGRRLDFLLQEIHREVNTLSAKATDTSISAAAVEMKAELEKLREQVQNVE